MISLGVAVASLGLGMYAASKAANPLGQAGASASSPLDYSGDATPRNVFGNTQAEQDAIDNTNAAKKDRNRRDIDELRAEMANPRYQQPGYADSLAALNAELQRLQAYGDTL